MNSQYHYAFAVIGIGENTRIERRISNPYGKTPTVELFGMTYTLDELAAEGWHYEIHYTDRPVRPHMCRAWRA